MTKLEYTFKNDTLFKMLFVKNPDLLKRLVSQLLGISYGEIGEFKIMNSEISPEILGEKFCRLDINMKVNDQRVDLEIQVHDEGDYPERALYYWAREYSSALFAGEDYKRLPRTVVISIVAFALFDCTDFHSEFQVLEVKRHEPLTDKEVIHFYELPKLSAEMLANDELCLWLNLFKAETEEDLTRIEEMEVHVMEQAITAYRTITATEEFKELERIRSYARHNEASALRHAAEVERKKWQGVVVNLQDVVASKDAALANKDAALANKDAALADKDSENEKLRKQIEELLTKINN